MSLSLRLATATTVVTFATVAIGALLTGLLSSGSPLEGGVAWVILLAGIPAAMISGLAGYVAGQRLTRRLRSLLGSGEGVNRQSPGGDVVWTLEQKMAALTSAHHEGETLLRALELELRDAREQLRGVATYLETAREGERKRIARDIHDDLGQALSTLKLDLSLLRDELGDQPGPVRDRIEAMTGLVGTSIRSVKRIISQLRPQVLDDLGLTPALEWQAEEFQKRTGIPVDLSIYPQEIILEPDHSTAVFRIFQETLANVARHARARSVRAALTEIDGVVELEVQDDGCGIRREQAEDRRSFGLLGIRERAHAWGGTVEIEGSPESGTRVRVRFELQEDT